MDYEKAYNNALERARNIRFGNPSSATANVVCEEIFPELKESEDEMIRKEIINYIKRQKITPNHPIADKWIAWLEKQGKPISRFKVGDKVLWKYDKSVVRTITKVRDCGTYWIECKGCSSGWWSEQELEPCVNKDEQKPTQSPMTKLEEKLSL